MYGAIVTLRGSIWIIAIDYRRSDGMEGYGQG